MKNYINYLNQKKSIAILIFCIILMNIFSGCSSQTQKAAVDNIPQKTSPSIQFTDDDGRKISLSAPCKRIISLYSAHTENLFSLGVGNLIIGVHDTSIYPPETQYIPIYDYMDDPETIISANPDLVLIRPFITRKVPNFVQAIEKAGITVVSLYPEKFEDFSEYINKLALVTGTEDVAVEQLNLFNKNITVISSLTKDIANKQKVFFESTEVNLRTITDNSMAAHAIAFAGGINVAEGSQPAEKDSSIALFGDERILSLADEIDVYVSQRGSMNAGGNLHSIYTRPGYSTINAVKNNRVYEINEKIISSPTFRFYKGIRELARYLYPDVIDDISQYKKDTASSKRDLSNILVRQLHIPIYVTSSSKYYQTDKEGHIYGMFDDVTWLDDDFDYIETAAMRGYITYVENAQKQFFEPDAPVTRDMLAKTVFLLGNFTNKKQNTAISDIAQCDNTNIVQILVDNRVFSLNTGKFEPRRIVTCNEIIDALKSVSYTSK
jgi:iron complex transport system substrate-binding protein